ncbi:MAG: TatD family hydrolase [Victivallales bacterium]|nr:TatD family hydrolase [Victivallales bacterium]
MKLSTHDLPGIEFIDFHTHKQEAPEKALNILSVELADAVELQLENPDRIYFSIGMHPWRLPENTDRLDVHIDKMRRMLQIPEVIALGEIGLDRLRGPELPVQETFLAELFRLAAVLDETVIVHCVRCYPELLALKNNFAPRQKMLIHGFNGKIDLLEQLIKAGHYVSLSPQALERDDLCRAIREKPIFLSRICLETDAFPLTVMEVYDSAARALKLEKAELALIMKANFSALFQGTANYNEWL